ncbi:MAG: hypothetical protein JWN03_6415 [Nocardia sp.]|nr:hypothetical protein [Nocardia sp.]
MAVWRLRMECRLSVVSRLQVGSRLLAGLRLQVGLRLLAGLRPPVVLPLRVGPCREVESCPAEGSSRAAGWRPEAGFRLAGDRERPRAAAERRRAGSRRTVRRSRFH